jgi:hypothetical protein
MDRSWLADLDPDTVRPGALGLLVVLALVVATALLLRSFTRQLKRIDFVEEPVESSPEDDPARRQEGRE